LAAVAETVRRGDCRLFPQYIELSNEVSLGRGNKGRERQYPRHEYFRRILCNLLGGEIEAGLLPRELGLIGSLVQDVCYLNARAYFRFPGT